MHCFTIFLMRIQTMWTAFQFFKRVDSTFHSLDFEILSSYIVHKEIQRWMETLTNKTNSITKHWNTGPPVWTKVKAHSIAYWKKKKKSIGPYIIVHVFYDVHKAPKLWVSKMQQYRMLLFDQISIHKEQSSLLFDDNKIWEMFRAQNNRGNFLYPPLAIRGWRSKVTWTSLCLMGDE